MLYTPAFWAMALANFCHTASYTTFFLLPLYILEQGGDRGDVGIIMGVFAMASAFCRPWISGMIDQIGRKRSYTIGSLLMVVPPLLYISFSSPLQTVYPLFLLLRIAHGVGLAICFTAVFTFMADILPQHRLNEGIGIFGISGLIGIAFGPMLAEITLERYGFIGLFISAAILSTIALLVHQPLKDRHVKPPPHQPSITFFSLFQRRKFVLVGYLSFMFGIGLAASGNFVAPLAETRSLAVISAYFICYSSGAIAIRFIGGRLADRVGERRVLPYSILLYIAGLLALPLTYSIPMLCVAGSLSGIGHGLMFPVLNTLAVRGEPAGMRGKATGIFTGGIDTGIFAGSFLLGYIGNRFNLNLLFLVASLAMASGFLAMLCIKGHPLNEEQKRL